MALINYAKGQQSSAQGGGWQPLPEGLYDVKILAAEQGTSKAGNPQIRVSGEVLDGTYAGRTVNVWYSLLPQSTWKLDALLNALDVDRVDTGDFYPDGSPILAFDPDHLVGRAVRYTVRQREYPAGSGKLTNDFAEEARSPFDAFEDEAPVAPAPAAKPAPVAAAPAPAQQVLPGVDGAIRRRPRPAGSPS